MTNQSPNHRAVFLDKDGTLVENVPYNVDPAKIRLAPGATDALRRLHAAGFLLIVITNQSGVAMGRFREEDLAGVEGRIRQLLGEADVSLAGFYYCPHHPKGTAAGYALDCACRKPRPGLVLRAAEEHAIDLAASWFVGDILDDVEAGHRAGCRTVLVDRGSETEWQLSPLRLPDCLATDIEDAADQILAFQRTEDLRAETAGGRPFQAIGDGPAGAPVPAARKGRPTKTPMRDFR